MWWQVGRSMKERLGLRRQERLRFSIHRYTKKRFVSTLLHHLNVNVWMYVQGGEEEV